MTNRLFRYVGAPLGAVALGLAIASSALAGGGPGTPPPAYNFYPQAFAVNPAGEFVLTGTVVCQVGLTGVVEASVVQEVGNNGPVVFGENAVEVACDPAIGSADVVLTVAGDQPRGFRSGTVDIYLQFEGETVPNADGEYEYFNQWGMIFDQAVRPAQ